MRESKNERCRVKETGGRGGGSRGRRRKMIRVKVCAISAGQSLDHGGDCLVCLNKSYTNKRTKFKITAALQRETQQVNTAILTYHHSLLNASYATIQCKYFVEGAFCSEVLS